VASSVGSSSSPPSTLSFAKIWAPPPAGIEIHTKREGINSAFHIYLNKAEGRRLRKECTIMPMEPAAWLVDLKSKRNLCKKSCNCVPMEDYNKCAEEKRSHLLHVLGELVGQHTAEHAISVRVARRRAGSPTDTIVPDHERS